MSTPLVPFCGEVISRGGDRRLARASGVGVLDGLGSVGDPPPHRTNIITAARTENKRNASASDRFRLLPAAILLAWRSDRLLSDGIGTSVGFSIALTAWTTGSSV